MGRFRRGWKLAKACWKVLWLDKEILLFPLLAIITLLLTGLLAWVIFSGIFTLFTTYQTALSGMIIVTVASISLLLFFYFLIWFLFCFFSAAIIECARLRFEGKDPHLEDGLRLANQRKMLILKWAFFAGTVGLILQRFQRGGRGSQIAGAVGTVAWELLTMFVLPIMIYENISPKEALKRSALLFKKLWGETLSGGLGLGLPFLIIFILGVGVSILLAVLTGSKAWAIGFLVFILLLTAILRSTMQSVLIAGLYLYGTKGKLPGYLTKEDLKL